MMAAATPAKPADMLGEAMSLADLGFRVVPIPPGGKHPPIDAWQTAATSDPDMIRRWWGGLYRGHGIGILTGGPLWVLDIDTGVDKAGQRKVGDETLYDLERTYGALPETVEAITGSGGRHLYFRKAPELDLRNEQSGRLGLDIDVRGHNGQVVAPPSIHANGRPYAWVDGHAPDQIEMAEAPAWMTEILTKQPVYKPAKESSGSGDDGPAQRFNERTTWEQLLRADQWTFHHMNREGVAYWTRPGKERREGHSASVGYEGRDVIKVFSSSVYWLPPVNPRTGRTAYSRFAYYAARWFNHDTSAAAKSIIEEEQRMGIGTEEPAVQISLAPDPEPAPAPPADATERPEDPNAFLRSLLIDWAEFWKQDHHAEEWLIRPLIPAGRAVSLYAPGGTGKSLLALYSAARAACGREVLGAVPERCLSVLYLDYEMTKSDLAERLESMGFNEDDDLSNLHYALLPAISPLDDPAGASAVVRLAEMVGADLVVVDTFARAVKGDENEADTVREFYRLTGQALKAAGRSLLRIDHAGKDPEKGARGSSAKRDDVDVVWRMTPRDGGAFTLRADKRRMSWVPETIEMTRIDDADGLRFALPASSIAGWPAGTAEMAELLDALNVDLWASQRAAAKVVRDAGRAARNVVIRAALKYRLGRAPMIGAHSDEAPRPGNSGALGAHFAAEDVSAGQSIAERAPIGGAHRGAPDLSTAPSAPLSRGGAGGTDAPDGPIDHLADVIAEIG